jgi:hypothetical protein
MKQHKDTFQVTWEELEYHHLSRGLYSDFFEYPPKILMLLEKFYDNG